MVEVNQHNAGEIAKTVRGGCVVGPSTDRRSPSIAALAAAMNKAQAEMKNPAKDSLNPFFKSKYADLSAVREAVLPALNKHGLSVMQFPCELDDAPALTTLLTHTSGEWVETTMKVRPTKSDPQAIGSAVTYARRYALQSITGVAADDDDDGHAASQPAKQQPQQPPEPVHAPTVARFVQHFAQCESRQDYTDVCEQIAAGVQASQINAATREALRKSAQATLDRVTQKQPANA